MTKLCVTGTREGFKTPEQEATFKGGLGFMHLTEHIEEFRHGYCRGVDAQAHRLIRELDPEIWIAGYPPIVKKNKEVWLDCDEVMEPADFHVRDRAFVDASNHLFVVPRSMREELRSGTWTTARYARDSLKPLTIFWPDGSIGDTF